MEADEAPQGFRRSHFQSSTNIPLSPQASGVPQYGTPTFSIPIRNSSYGMSRREENQSTYTDSQANEGQSYMDMMKR